MRPLVPTCFSPGSPGDKVGPSQEDHHILPALHSAAASKTDQPVCHPLIALSRGSKGLSNPRLLLIFGIQIWFLDVHQEAGSVHFN